MIDFAGDNSPKVCCRNYAAMVDYIRQYGDSADIERLFADVLGANLSPSPCYQMDGQPISYEYLTNGRHWVPSWLNSKIFSNLGKLPYNAFEIGRHTVKNMPANSNHVMAAFLHLLGPEHSVRLVDKINRQFNQTKAVLLSHFSCSGGCVELKYLPGVIHNHTITEQNLGCYIGTLELFGYQNATGRIETDQLGSEGQLGYSRLEFQFQGENLWQRIRWLTGYLLAGVFCRRYLQSHHVFDRYHREVIDAFHAELNQKEQALALNEQYYVALMQQKNQRTSELEQQVAERTASLSTEIVNRQRLVQQLSIELQIPLTLMQQQLEQLQQRQDDPVAVNSCSKKLQRALNQLHHQLQQMPDIQFQQQLLTKPDTLVEPEADLDFEEKFQRALNQHYAEENFNVTQLAQLLNCTERTLHRKTQHCFAKSPSALLREHRINQAKLLLQNGNSIKVAAHLSGFSNLSYFSASFKKTTAQTPSEYLKSLSQNSV
ncbi:helix-turn-helix transcriptional regulator [Shewanella avicenniae]|uniref:Helix-turn-helix transcriptional regulator n=1 Tax=Shewanella avicenniae TaxID=2814294 RepID=A0ABX7QSN5_9GAMM|nr:helix-turn-helix transcriptional regulator [Shewanella avicenniae]QSX34486.1 helix-turn-helix transcriptional regulator [Shewanella avicenniae]